MWDTNTNSKLQIGANIAILLGLVMVAFQINQANDISSAEFLDTGITADNTRQLVMLGENPNESMYRVLHAPDQATPEDYFIADRIYETVIAQVQRSIILTDEDLYLGSVRGLIRSNYELFSCPYGIAYLNQIISRMEREAANRNANPTGNGAPANALSEQTLLSVKRMHSLASNAAANGSFQRRIEDAKVLIENGIQRVARPNNDNRE